MFKISHIHQTFLPISFNHIFLMIFKDIISNSPPRHLYENPILFIVHTFNFWEDLTSNCPLFLAPSLFKPIDHYEQQFPIFLKCFNFLTCLPMLLVYLHIFHQFCMVIYTQNFHKPVFDQLNIFTNTSHAKYVLLTQTLNALLFSFFYSKVTFLDVHASPICPP